MTIIVLLILAGISVNILITNNRIIAKSKDAKNQLEEMQDSTSTNREDLYEEIVGNKTDYGQAGEVEVSLTLTKNSDTSITAKANATGTISPIISYTFYIKKLTEDDSAYVIIKKSDKLSNTATCNGLEKDSVYKVKVIAMDKDGVSKTAQKNIVLGDAIKISVTPVSGPDSYPSIISVTANSIISNMDYIEMPSGEKVYARNGKFNLKTTYNSTKNGPITFKAYDKEGNSAKLEYMEQNVINFETEWTFASTNTTVTVPVTGTVDVYIDYGDGTKENVTSANPTHTYTTAGTYTMKISGRCNWFSNNTSTQNYLTGLKKWGCLSNQSYSFENCEKLKGNIPEPHKKSFAKITSFYRTFVSDGGIGGLITLTGSIPENLFANCPNVTSFAETFFGCIGLTGNIPENLFANCPNVTDFGDTFYYCSGLTGNIPENLFANCPNVTSVQETFGHCSGLTGSIPEKLFANCPNITSFDGTFTGCGGLTEIPENLFADFSNVTDFYGTFSGCSGLTRIPENLFANCPNITNFSWTFAYCSGLTEIPKNLFTNCPNVTNFRASFLDCRGITGIPENLFSNCLKVTDFGATFKNCSGLTGNAPELWTRVPNGASNGYQGTPGGQNCFSGCTNLTNYSSIPPFWKY